MDLHSTTQPSAAASVVDQCFTRFGSVMFMVVCGTARAITVLHTEVSLYLAAHLQYRQHNSCSVRGIAEDEVVQ